MIWKTFRQTHSKTPGHPEYGHTHGIEITTGPLGQGIANAVGFAAAGKYAQNILGVKLLIIKFIVYVVMEIYKKVFLMKQLQVLDI